MTLEVTIETDTYDERRADCIVNKESIANKKSVSKMQKGEKNGYQETMNFWCVITIYQRTETAKQQVTNIAEHQELQHMFSLPDAASFVQTDFRSFFPNKHKRKQTDAGFIVTCKLDKISVIVTHCWRESFKLRKCAFIWYSWTQQASVQVIMKTFC